MIGTPARFTIRALLAALIFTGVAGVLGGAVPTTAGAYATIEGPPVYSSAPGLPDNRVYEQVSPADKNGNNAGAGGEAEAAAGSNLGGVFRYAHAAADGNSVLFEGTGAMGETAAAYNSYFVATRSPGGWATRSAQPRAHETTIEIGGALNTVPKALDPAADLSHAMFESTEGEFAANMLLDCGPSGTKDPNQMYLAGPDPFAVATWLESPETQGSVSNCGGAVEAGVPLGGTPDFSTVYFAYPGTLLPADAARAPHAHGTVEYYLEREKLEAEKIEAETGDFIGGEDVEAWGLYEDREGELREVATLPDGKLDPFGAVPAGGTGREGVRAGNEVSADGTRVFFVSPDPSSCEPRGHNDCAVDPPELYVRENGATTELVSRDTLLPEAGGLPAPAPAGAEGPAASFQFASSDGSQAFFQSDGDLTQAAAEASPDAEPKTYDFDVDTGALTYLPNVDGKIVAVDTDGSVFAFVRPAAGAAPAELELWSAGLAGGSVTPIAQLAGAEPEQVYPARMSSDGSVVVFTTASTLSSAFNSGGFEQIYRYDSSGNTLGCVSCTPAGVTPTAPAVMSQLRSYENKNAYGHGNSLKQNGLVEPRGISADGDRIFFDTPDPLVPQDTNTRAHLPGSYKEYGRDVYEWENGVVYLISGGKGTENSYFLDNSENGDDVFFATAEGLAPGDTDGAYDVYDARVPRETQAPAAVPCEGSVCQGPPNVPSPLTPPASATFSGLGNPSPEPAATPPPPTGNRSRRGETVKCKRGFTKKHGKCVPKPRTKKSSKKKGK